MSHRSLAARPRRFSLRLPILLLSLSMLPVQPLAAAPVPGGRPAGAETNLKPWNEAEIVFVGKLTDAVAGPVARSLPPVHSHTLKFDVEAVLRGDQMTNVPLELNHSARQNKPPVFPIGQVCIVSASNVRGRLIADRVEVSTPEKLLDVTVACTLPLGWQVVEGQPVSPWASLGKKAWSPDAVDESLEEETVCATTGRPALLVGPGVEFQVEKVPPVKEIKWSNPDGDGEYRITVTNRTDEPVTIPALLTVGDRVLWDESLVILCQGQAYPIPGAVSVSGQVIPTTLGPGESLSTVVNALRLDGPKWPQGGYRIEFQFCLGEKSQTMSFYYRSKHHDKVREKLAE